MHTLSIGMRFAITKGGLSSIRIARASWLLRLKPASLPRYNKQTVRRPRKLPLPLPTSLCAQSHSRALQWLLLPPTCCHATLRPESRASTMFQATGVPPREHFITNVGGTRCTPRYYHHHALLEATHSIFDPDASCRRETGLVTMCSFAETDPK